jgi:hypothetical protein
MWDGPGDSTYVGVVTVVFVSVWPLEQKHVVRPGNKEVKRVRWDVVRMLSRLQTPRNPASVRQ